MVSRQDHEELMDELEALWQEIQMIHRQLVLMPEPRNEREHTRVELLQANLEKRRSQAEALIESLHGRDQSVA